jgi:signal peptidase I
MRAVWVGVIAAALWLVLRRPVRYEIADRSMEPTLQSGDWVIAWQRVGRVHVGDVVVVEHPHRPGFEMVKRVAGLEGEPGPDSPVRGVWLLGDNPEAGSVDSRIIGVFPKSSLRARVVARYRPLPLRRIR